MKSLSELRFAAQYQYSVHGTTPKSQASREKCRAIKEARPKAIAQAAARVRESYDNGLFHDFLGPDFVLVPTPGSAPRYAGSLWTPERICEALASLGLGARVATFLERRTRVKKSAFCAPKERPKAIDHFNSIASAAAELGVERLTLVDDVVTRGATLFGAANRLALIYPKVPIQAFALLRAISPGEIERFREPVDDGIIRLSSNRNAMRRP